MSRLTIGNALVSPGVELGLRHLERVQEGLTEQVRSRIIGDLDLIIVGHRLGYRAVQREAHGGLQRRTIERGLG